MANNSVRSVVESSICCSTSGNIVQIAFEWAIDNFSYRLHSTTPLHTAGVKTVEHLGLKDVPEMEWYVRLLPKNPNPSGASSGVTIANSPTTRETTPANSEADRDSVVAVYVGCRLVGNESISARYNLSILGKDGPAFSKGTVKPVMFTVKNPIRGIPQYISHEELVRDDQKYLPNDVLQLHVTIGFLVTSSFKHSFQPVKTEPDMMPLARDVATLWRTKDFADIQLVSKVDKNSKVVPVHRCILAARSPRFAELFTAPIGNGRVEVDMDLETLDVLLEYLYTSSTARVASAARKILTVAGEYRLDGLKVAAETELCGAVNIANAVDMLLTADKLAMEKLLNAAMQCICEKMTVFLNGNGMETLRKHNVELSKKVMAYFGTRYFSNGERDGVPAPKKLRSSAT